MSVSSSCSVLGEQAVIKSAYSLGGQLINSTWGTEAHTGSINPLLASPLSLRMSGFFFFFPLSFKEKMKIISAELESELTELCARDLFIMIWCCSGQCVCLAGDHPAVPSIPGSPCWAAQPAAGRGPFGRALPEAEPGAGMQHWVDAARSWWLLFSCPSPLSSAAAVQGRRCCWRQQQLLGVGLVPNGAEEHNGLGFF